MLNSFDFKFSKYEPDYKDYWFEVSGDSAETLTREYKDKNTLGVTEVMYSAHDDSVKVKRPILTGAVVSGYDIVTSCNDLLKEILLHKVNEIIHLFGASE